MRFIAVGAKSMLDVDAAWAASINEVCVTNAPCMNSFYCASLCKLAEP